MLLVAGASKEAPLLVDTDGSSDSATGAGADRLARPAALDVRRDDRDRRLLGPLL